MDKHGPDRQAIGHLTYLGRLTDQIAALEEAQRASVALCRAHGASWRSVGVALGTSAQAAWTRFGNHDASATPIKGQQTLLEVTDDKPNQRHRSRRKTDQD